MKFAATFYKKRRCAIIAIRKKQLTVRFTEEEYAALKGKCEIAGMKMEPFVRALVDGCRIKPAPPDSYNKLRQQLSAIGNNLNQLTHVANATGRVSASQLDRAQSLLEDMLNAGKIKAFRIGRSYRIPKVNVIRFLQNETPEDCNTVNATIDSVE